MSVVSRAAGVSAALKIFHQHLKEEGMRMVQKEWRLLKLGSRSAPAPAHTWGRPARHVREVLPVRRSKLGLDCLNKKRGLTIHG